MNEREWITWTLVYAAAINAREPSPALQANTAIMHLRYQENESDPTPPESWPSTSDDIANPF